MFVLGKKPKRKAQAGIPVEMVQNLASQGLSEQEIVGILRRQGYSQSQIEKAISLALKSAVSGARFPQAPQAQQSFPAQPKTFAQPMRREQTFTQPMQSMASPKVPEIHTMPMPTSQPQEETLFTFEKTPSYMFQREQLSKPPEPEPLREEPIGSEAENESFPTPEITLEEIVEGIVAEKWASFEEKIEALRKKDDELQSQIMNIMKEIDMLKESIRKSEESFLAKLEEQSGQVANIEAKIGSIEKIFKEFLPELTESMRLITQALEKSKKGG